MENEAICTVDKLPSYKRIGYRVGSLIYGEFRCKISTKWLGIEKEVRFLVAAVDLSISTGTGEFRWIDPAPNHGGYEGLN